MGTRRTIAVAMVTALAGCGDSSLDLTEAELHLEVVSACPPVQPPSAVEVRAVGNFLPTDFNTETITREEPGERITRFPLETRAFAVRAYGQGDWTGYGLRLFDGREGPLPVLLLPLAQSCMRAESVASFLPGTAYAPTPDGGLMLVGGIGGTRAPLLRVVRIPPGSGEPESAMIDPERTARRSHATATLTGDRIVVAGGTPGDAALAHESIEVYDELGAFLGGARMCGLDQECGRRDHGAIALDDGRVLLVGGRSGVGQPPLATAALIDAAEIEVTPLDSELTVARTQPTVALLDDGLVLIVGGQTQTGAAALVEAFDPAQGAIVGVSDPAGEPVSLPPRPGGLGVALPGARFVWFGEGARDGVLLQRVRNALGGVTMRVDPIPQLLPRPLENVRAIALDDGSLFVTGTYGVPRAYRLDIGRGQGTEVMAPICPNCPDPPGALLPLIDGTIAELYVTGVSLRRETFTTPFDAVPQSLDLERYAQLAYDTPAHWAHGPGSVIALDDDARLDIASLRFDAFDLTVENTGDIELLFVRDGLSPLAIRLGGSVAGPALCEIERNGARVSVSRDGPNLAITTDAGIKQCVLPELRGLVGIAFRAAPDSSISLIQLARR